MNERGFTLVELIIVIAIMIILLSLATMAFNQYLQKANIEAQVRMMYADLMDARAQAIMQRDTRTVLVSTSQLAFYNSVGNMISQEAPYHFPVIYPVGNEQITFDTMGMASGAGIPMTICVQPVGSTSASVDAIQIDQTMIQMAKVTGGACNRASITIQ